MIQGSICSTMSELNAHLLKQYTIYVKINLSWCCHGKSAFSFWSNQTSTFWFCQIHSPSNSLHHICWVIFHAPVVLNLLTFFKIIFFKIRVSNILIADQDRHSVDPDLGPNCLQRLSASEKKYIVSKKRVKKSFRINYCMFLDVGKSCTSCKFLTSQTCLLTVLRK